MSDYIQHLRAAKHTLLVFGPQALSFQQDTFDRLRATLTNEPKLEWIYNGLAELPQQWDTLVQSLPQLAAAPGREAIERLVNALKTGEIEHEWARLSNVVLTPLVVAAQLSQYVQYLEVTGRTIGVRHSKSGANLDTIGLCPGLLSALAVSCSSNEQELRQYGAVAIRLAMFIGAVVDAQDFNSVEGRSQSLAVMWNSVGEETAFTHILDEFNDAYISVNYDQTRATVTVAEKDIGDLQAKLRASGLNVNNVALFGRFHSACHEEDFQQLSKLCDSNSDYRFTIVSKADLPLSSCAHKGLSVSASALRSILVERAEWFRDVRSACKVAPESVAACFGYEKCIPATVFRSLGSKRIYQITDIVEANLETGLPSPSSAQPPPRPQHSDDDIAVVGMACKFANADDMDELWNVLLSGKSQHTEVPEDRFEMNTAFRTTMKKKQKWFANFLRDHDAFDHQFFKKSPREASSMDPQQRLFLQVAYQTLESAGYFSQANPEQHVGCYVGSCSQDYQTNIACHDPNAYTATGNLTSFVAGKIGHAFGWTGPAMVIDTACSSSAVAIHQGCRAILAGDCKQALAGGAIVMTSPLWWHNLSGASFLSTTGSCKPFDASADGYCRGEGVAGVMLKKMSDAVADGDQIFGCIAATGVLQNENCTPIVVPNAPSLSTLFRGVLRKSGLKPQDITVAEAHGTGTPVGDPAEWDSLRQVLGGRQQRQQTLNVGSVKGHIGHTECTSGAAALLKVLLMMHHGRIPQQASFQRLSPKLKNVPEDMMQVLTHSKSWDADFRAALINNYGASGSNASMIVTQPFQTQLSTSEFAIHTDGLKHPFWLAGNKEDDIKRNAGRLLAWIKGQDSPVLPSDLAFNLSRRNNRSMLLGLSFAATSTQDVQHHLERFLNGDSSEIVSVVEPPKSVVLCFGGQVSTSVSLDKSIYDQFRVLRNHLDECNAIMERMGLSSIYPHIFDRTPIKDTVLLQTMLFAMQYSCAQSWIDCGIDVTAAVGHSFGELTALAICGILSLPDAIKVVSRRAKLVRDNWGPESGAMMAVEASMHSVQDLLKASAVSARAEGETPATIACYNSPTTFTLAGSDKAIMAVSKAILSSPTPIRSKRLNVTNAFHSTLVEPLIPELNKVMDGITIRSARIPLIHANDSGVTGPIGLDFVARHLRQPVHFFSAIQRLAEKYPSAVFLEAGSNSTITNMASKALGAPKDTLFQPLNITSATSASNISDVTQALRKAGVPVQFWAHNSTQTYEFAIQLLPPYQFAKSRHWLALQNLPEGTNLGTAQQAAAVEAEPTKMWSFIGYQDQEKSLARFRINTQNEEYEKYLVGHIIAEEAPICPATLEIDLVIEAIRTLHPELATQDWRPVIRHVENQAPICRDPSRTVWLDLFATGRAEHCWDWKMFSTGQQGGTPATHVTGHAVLKKAEDKDYQVDFARYERLVGHERCTQLLNHGDPDDLIYGRNIYRAFKDVVDYGEIYRGVQKLVGKGHESAGRVTKDYTGETWFDAVMGDCFSQVGGIYVNCMTDRSPNTLYIANAIEQWIRSPKTPSESKQPRTWDVFATHQKISGKSYCTDIFVFDAATGALSEVILGIHYAQVSKTGMRRMLSRNTPEALRASSAAVAEMDSLITGPPAVVEAKPELAVEAPTQAAAVPVKRAPNIPAKLKAIIAELCGLELPEIKDDASLGDLGIDSLMAMELCKEIETAFNCEIPEDDRGEVTDFPGLVACVKKHVGGTSVPSSDDGSSASSSGADSVATPATSVSHSPTISHVKPVLAQPPAVPAAKAELEVPNSTWIESFREMNTTTDRGIADCGFGDYLKGANVKQTELCVMMIIEAFEKLGTNIRTAVQGDIVRKISYVPDQEHLVNYCYRILDVEAGLLRRDDGVYIRTEVPLPSQSSKELLAALQTDHTHHKDATQLAYFCGSKFADVFQGKESGVRMMFGTEEGRDLVSKLYGTWPLNYNYYQRMATFFERVATRIPRNGAPLRILEMGGGTAGTTKVILPRLAQLDIPIEYTFTDLSPAFVAQARKRFKNFNFLKYRAHDIEKPPPEDLINSQHVVVASNAVHATHNLGESTSNIRKFLRDDGILLMLEMTTPVCFIDIIFGLFEGWWMFSDDRDHAISHETRWQRVMQSVGYGHVEWTNGSRPENQIEKLIMGLASGPRYEHLPVAPAREVAIELEGADLDARQTVIDSFVRKYTAGWTPPRNATTSKSDHSHGHTVLITGATGSLGAHLVAHVANLPEVVKVICVNRKSRTDVKQRQQESFDTRGIELDAAALGKLEVIATDTSLPNIGLSPAEYHTLAQQVTHICHNAWPMSAARAVGGFEGQFQVMRNLIDLTTSATFHRRSQVSFQLVSSIAVVGHYPLWTGNAEVPEERMTIRSILPNGYGDAKWVCERMLDETLHRNPDRFRTMTIRPGQIAGSAKSGHWNTHEHLSFLIKSCQTLNAIPAFEGELSWTPVEDVAGTCADTLISDRKPCPVYHIDNPVRQSWEPMLEVWADALDVPRANIIPFKAWIDKVRGFTGKASENPAIKLVDFLDGNFVRMSCGGLLMGTEKSCEHSVTLASVGPVSEEVTRRYIRAWQESGWLK